jgi:hypothetical protein
MYWLGAIFVLGIMALPPNIFSSGNVSFAIETAQVKTEDQKAAEDMQIVRKKFEELDAENKQKAIRLGYKEGDMVEMRQEPGGILVILPPPQEIMTPEKMKEKLLALVAEKIARKVDDENVNIKFMLAMDLTGNFTVRTLFDNLHQGIREEAAKMGFKERDAIEVQVDATTWEYHIIPAQKVKEFKSEVLEIIPPKEPNGLPSYRCVAKFEDLPEMVQKKAKAVGYKNDEAVRFIYHEATKEYEILPSPLLIGLPNPWENLTAKEQEKALKLGYKEGDSVWKTSDAKGKLNIPEKVSIKALNIDGSVQLVIDTKGMFELAPASRVVTPPLLKITHVILKQDFSGGNVSNIILLRGTAKFEDLSDSQKEKALAAGYKAGDEVLLYYNPEANSYETKSKPTE